MLESIEQKVRVDLRLQRLEFRLTEQALRLELHLALGHELHPLLVQLGLHPVAQAGLGNIARRNGQQARDLRNAPVVDERRAFRLRRIRAPRLLREEQLELLHVLRLDAEAACHDRRNVDVLGDDRDGRAGEAGKAAVEIRRPVARAAAAAGQRAAHADVPQLLRPVGPAAEVVLDIVHGKKPLVLTGAHGDAEVGDRVNGAKQLVEHLVAHQVADRQPVHKLAVRLDGRERRSVIDQGKTPLCLDSDPSAAPAQDRHGSCKLID